LGETDEDRIKESDLVTLRPPSCPVGKEEDRPGYEEAEPDDQKRCERRLDPALKEKAEEDDRNRPYYEPSHLAAFASPMKDPTHKSNQVATEEEKDSSQRPQVECRLQEDARWVEPEEALGKDEVCRA
jgi:hypothetical protein